MTSSNPPSPSNTSNSPSPSHTPPLPDDGRTWLQREIHNGGAPTPTHILELRNHIFVISYFAREVERLAADQLYEAPTVDSALIYANRIHDLLKNMDERFEYVHNYLLQRYEAMHLVSSSSSENLSDPQ